MGPPFLSVSLSVLSFCLGQEWLIGAERERRNKTRFPSYINRELKGIAKVLVKSAGRECTE